MWVNVLAIGSFAAILYLCVLGGFCFVEALNDWNRKGPDGGDF